MLDAVQVMVAQVKLALRYLVNVATLELKRIYTVRHVYQRLVACPVISGRAVFYSVHVLRIFRVAATA